MTAPLVEGVREDSEGTGAAILALVKAQGVVSQARLCDRIGIHRNAVHYHVGRLRAGRRVHRLCVGRQVLLHHPRIAAATALTLWALRQPALNAVLECLEASLHVHLTRLSHASGLDRFATKRFLTHLCRHGLVEAPDVPQRPYRVAGLPSCLQEARHFQTCHEWVRSQNPSGCAQEGV